jgi:Zn-dependent peptidase ImmA (M78 family)
MHSLLLKFRTLFKDFNRKPLTEKDLLRACRRHGVAVVEEESDDMEWPAFYVVIDGRPTIFLKAGLTGLKRLWALAHELGHHLLHSPATCFFSGDTAGKAEHEANCFAAYALMPEAVVRQIPLWEFYEVNEDSAKLLLIRLEFFDTYKL